MIRDRGERLDRLAAAVFEGTTGRQRLAPLLERFDREVGAPRQDDEDAELLHAIRVDWALCDAGIGERDGDTWAWRAATGGTEGRGVDTEMGETARTWASVFEVWPGAPTLLRDALGGVVGPAVDPIEGLEPERGRPAALWEVRVGSCEAGLRMWRAPLEYPVELASELGRFRTRFPTDPGRGLAQLRRARLTWVRSGRRSRFRV